MKNLSYCNSCHAAIAFLETKKGNQMPVNSDSLSTEDLTILSNGGSINFRFGEHISHFATCPEAKKFRKAKK